MAKIKTAQLKCVGIMTEGILPGSRALRESVEEWEFPLKITQVVKQDDCELHHEYEVRLSKRKTLSMHHVGMSVKKNRDLAD